MNIALVSMNASPLSRLGGGEGSGQSVLVDGLARALGALGHAVTVFVRRDDLSAPARLAAATRVEIVFIEAGPARPVAAGELLPLSSDFARGLKEAWAGDPPDAIHAFGWISGQAAAAAAHGVDAPVVHTLRPPALGPRRDETFDRQAALVRTGARIIATSSSHVFALLGLGASPAAIKFVPCGVDVGVFGPAPRPARDPAGRLRIATLCGLRLSEGVGDVIEALSFVDGVELVVGGGTHSGSNVLADPEAARLHAVAQRHGVGDRVAFRGHVQRGDAAAFLRAADLVVCAPHDDSLGTTALEAMACGIPVVASTVGGLVDAVADGITGVHVPARAPRQLAYAIEALRTDGPRRARFGRVGVERATARYAWPRIAGETFEVYRSVAAVAPHLSENRA